MSDVELLELPAPFRGLAYRDKLAAFQTAEAMLPGPAILAVLGAATAELILVNAAAHVLTVSDVVDLSVASIEPSAASTRAGSPNNHGQWAGSSYGDLVAAALDRLPRPSGRGRCFPPILS